MSLLEIVKNKKIRIIYLALLVIIIFSLLDRNYKDKDEVEQAFNNFLENKNFTSVKFELYANGPILEEREMTVNEVEKLWSIIETSKPGSGGTKKNLDFLLMVYFESTDGTKITFSFSKDFNVAQVRISFYLTEKAGYGLVGEDHVGFIDQLVSLAGQ